MNKTEKRTKKSGLSKELIGQGPKSFLNNDFNKYNS